MHAVSNAINILNSGIDKKICKKYKGSASEANLNSAGADECVGQSLTGTGKKWSEWFSTEGNTDYKGKEHEKWHAHNAGVVSKDTAALSREEKGVVSSNIDAKICKAHDKTSNTAGKCNLSAGSSAVSSGGDGNPDGLSKWFSSDKGAGQNNGAYAAGKEHEKWSVHKAGVVVLMLVVSGTAGRKDMSLGAPQGKCSYWCACSGCGWSRSSGDYLRWHKVRVVRYIKDYISV